MIHLFIHWNNIYFLIWAIILFYLNYLGNRDKRDYEWINKAQISAPFQWG